MLIISNTLLKNILSVNIFEYLFMFIIDFINNKWIVELQEDNGPGV